MQMRRFLLGFNKPKKSGRQVFSVVVVISSWSNYGHVVIASCHHVMASYNVVYIQHHHGLIMVVIISSQHLVTHNHLLWSHMFTYYGHQYCGLIRPSYHNHGLSCHHTNGLYANNVIIFLFILFINRRSDSTTSISYQGLFGKGSSKSGCTLISSMVHGICLWVLQFSKFSGSYAHALCEGKTLVGFRILCETTHLQYFFIKKDNILFKQFDYRIQSSTNS